MITMTATYDVDWFEDDEEDPYNEGGFTDPDNPWGGFRSELKAWENPGPEWCADNVKRVTFDSLVDAAEYVVDFPGGVWDWSECEAEQDVRTGRWTRVTLHVKSDEPARTLWEGPTMKVIRDDVAAVLNMATQLEDERTAAFRARYPR